MTLSVGACDKHEKSIELESFAFCTILNNSVLQIVNNCV